MKQIPTAEEFLNNHPQISHYYDDKTDKMVCFSEQVEQAMIEFAKLHIEAALKEVNEKAYVEFVDLVSGEIFDYPDVLVEEGVEININKNSILNSYPLENVK